MATSHTNGIKNTKLKEIEVLVRQNVRKLGALDVIIYPSKLLVFPFLLDKFV